MISETGFSKRYSSFWKENVPWINDYVRSINVGLVDRLFAPIEIDDKDHRSINNVVAFTLFKNTAIIKNDDIILAFNEARSIVKNYPRNNLETYSLTDCYIKIIRDQSSRLFSQFGSKVEFYPQFPGCGIMESCQGDLFYKETLVEIKGGERLFTPADIKQLVVYCALNWLSNNNYNICCVELFNPRQGTFWSSSVKDMIDSISNIPMEELFDQIGKYLLSMSEEVELF